MGELCTGGDLLRAKSAPASYYVDPANNIYCADPADCIYYVDPANNIYCVDPANNIYYVDPANNIFYSNLGIDISTITFKTGNTLKYWKIFRK